MSDFTTRLTAIGVEADALAGQVDTLTQANSALIGERDTLTAALREANTVIDRVTVERDDALGALDLCRARNVSLRERLAACEGSKAKTTAWGSSCGKHPYDTFTQMAGSPLEARRSYQTLGQPFPKEDVGRNISVTSVASNPNLTWADVYAVLWAYYESVPLTHDARTIKSHEPENPQKKYDPAKYVAEQQRIRAEIIDPINAQRKAAGGVPITFGGNWMAWSLQAASGRDMTKWWPGEGVWDFLAADGYSGRNETTGKWEGGRSPAAIFDPFVAFCEAHNVRFAVAETGIDVLETPDKRVAWIDACQQYTAEHNPEFWCYWDGSFSWFWLNTQAEFQAVVHHP